jgi:hypothetical protein
MIKAGLAAAPTRSGWATTASSFVKDLPDTPNMLQQRFIADTGKSGHIDLIGQQQIIELVFQRQQLGIVELRSLKGKVDIPRLWPFQGVEAS